MSTPVTVTDATFDELVLGSAQPVLVEFWATWCPPCRMLTPVLAEIAAQRAGSLTVATVNVDENPEVVARYRVLAAPTLGLYQGGELLRQTVGARSKSRLLREVDEALAA